MSVTLYQGDCLEYMRSMAVGSVDAVVTDPPYGINAGKMNLGFSRTSRMPKSDWDKYPADIAPLLDFGISIVIWGGNYFTLPPSRGWLVWHKGNSFKNRSFAECELAWTNIDAVARIFSYDPLANGDYRSKEHPTQKPIALMKWCIEKISKPGDTIFDPFMGSGTTGVACVKTGRNFIGCEIDPGYFAIAQKRIAEAQLQLPLLEVAA
jgi:DNA modification methylase